ncbi:MAG: hypothetical protein IJ469_08200 [Candidatus Methanomethylophilaceae archaeon]|nr:hypothetical protein [Candidatus Methanomethylophilaceae archaeon]
MNIDIIIDFLKTISPILYAVAGSVLSLFAKNIHDWVMRPKMRLEFERIDDGFTIVLRIHNDGKSVMEGLMVDVEMGHVQSSYYHIEESGVINPKSYVDIYIGREEFYQTDDDEDSCLCRDREVFLDYLRINLRVSAKAIEERQFEFKPGEILQGIDIGNKDTKPHIQRVKT